MAFKRKDSPFWWVSLTDQSGKRIKRSTGTRNRKEAEALEAKWRAEIYQQQMWAETPDISYEEVMLHYLNSRPDTQSQRAREEDLLRAKTLNRFYAGKIMNQLSARDILAHRNLRAREVSTGTINRELGQFSAAINRYNIDYEIELPNPVKGRKLKEPEGRIRWISKAESAALIAAAGQNPRAPLLVEFITLALNTGMRKQEMLGLEWRRVDLQNELIYLEAEHTKAGKRRTVPLNQNAKKTLIALMRFRAEHCPGSPWVFNTKKGARIGNMRRSFKTACDRTGIEDFRIHDLRHTYAAWLVTAGIPLPEVRDLLGHAAIRMTERYAHLAPENLKAAVAVLDTEPETQNRPKSRFSPVTKSKGR